MKKESILYPVAVFAAILAVVAASAFTDITVRVALGAVCALVSAIFCGLALRETMTRHQTNESARKQLQLESKQQSGELSEQTRDTIRQLFTELDEKSNLRIDIFRELFTSVQSSIQHLSEKQRTDHTEFVSQMQSMSDTLSKMIQDYTDKDDQSAASMITQFDTLSHAVEAVNQTLTTQMEAIRQVIEEIPIRVAAAMREAGKQVVDTIVENDRKIVETIQISSDILRQEVENNTGKIEQSVKGAIQQGQEIAKSMNQAEKFLTDQLATVHQTVENGLTRTVASTQEVGNLLTNVIESQGQEIAKSMNQAEKSLTDQLATVHQTVENGLTRTVASTQEVGNLLTNVIESKNQAMIETFQSGSETFSQTIEGSTSKIEESAVEILAQCDTLERCMHQVTEALDGIKSAVEEVSIHQLSGHKLEKESLGKISESISDMESAVQDVTRAVEHMEETAERQVESYDNIMQNYAHVTAQDAKLIEKVFSVQ